MASISILPTGNPSSSNPIESSLTNITPANSSILILNTTRSQLTSSAIDSKAGYGYFGSGSYPANIFKVRLSDFTNSVNLTLAQGENGASAATVDPSQDIAYFGTYSGQIVKVNLTRFTEVASLSPGLGAVASATVDRHNGFAYFGTETGNILKVRLSDFTVNKTLTLSPTTSVGAAVVDTANGYAYFGGSGCGINIYYTPPNVIVKVRLSDFAIVAELDPGEDCLTSAGIDQAGGFVYFSSSSLAGSYLIRFALSDFSTKGALAPTPADSASSFALDPARGLGYAVGGPYVSTFRLSDFNQIASAYLQNSFSEFNERNAVLDPATGYFYFTGLKLLPPFSQTGVIVRVSPAALPSNDFSLEANPNHLSFQDGGVGAGYVNVLSNNYSGTVDLSSAVSSIYVLKPATEIVHPTLALTANGESSSIIAVSAPTQDDVPASTYIVIVTGTSGSMSRSISLQVTLTPGPADFQVYIQPQSIGLIPGAGPNRGEYDPGIALGTHTGFAGTFNFTAAISPTIPNGPMISVSPTSVQFNLPRETWTGLANVFVSTNSTTSTGQYEIDVTAASGALRHTASLCLVVVRQGVVQFCLLSSQNKLSIGPGQARTSLITLYKTLGLFNITNSYLGTVYMSSSIVSGPSPNAVGATLSPASFNLPYELPGSQTLRSTLTVSASSNALSGDYVVRIGATNGTVSGSVDIPVTVTSGPVPGVPGLFPGGWAEYQTSSTWESTSAGLPPILGVSQYLNAYGATLRAAANVGNESASLLSVGYLNGTQKVQSIEGNTMAESGTLFPWVVGSSLSFNTTGVRVFAGASRLTSTLGLTETNSSVIATGTWTWDSQTGILLDYRLTVQGTGNLGTINGLVHVTMVNTNLWNPTQPYFTLEASTTFLTIKTQTTTKTMIRLTSGNNFSGSVTLTAQPLPSNLSLPVSIDGTVGLQPGQTANATLTISPSIGGQYIILVNATSGPQFHFLLIGITVINSNDIAPVLSITSLSPRPANPGQPVRLDFTAIDPDGSVIATWVDWGDGSKPDLILNMTSGSMCQKLNPVLSTNSCTIAPGDLVFAQSQDPSTIVNGSIIIFRPLLQNPDYLVLHRVIKIIPPDSNAYNEYSFWTAGDANGSMDPWDVSGGIPSSQIVGVYLFTLKPSEGIPGERYDTHAYPNLGSSLPRTYTIRVNATDDSRSHTEVTTIETIDDLQPTAAIKSVSPSQILAGTTVTLAFSAMDPDGKIVSISISWGDGTGTNNLPGSTTSQTHTYNLAGNYTIRISATDDSGSTSQAATMTVTVETQPSPASKVPTILGLAPLLFYGMMGAITIALGTVTALALRARKKPRPAVESNSTRRVYTTFSSCRRRVACLVAFL